MPMKVKSFPTDYSRVFSSIDLNNPYIHTNRGLYFLETVDGEGSIYIYLPSDLEFSAWNVTVLASGPCEPVCFISETGWKDLADKEKFMLIIGIPSGQPSGNDGYLGLMEHLSAAVCNKQHYDAQPFCSYAVAYGSACCSLFSYACLNPETYAGVAFVGEPVFAGDLAAMTERGRAVLPYVPAAEVALPAYFECDSGNNACEAAIQLFKKRNNTVEEPFIQGDMSVYPALQNVRRDSVNGQACASVVVREPLSTPAKSSSSAWSYLRKVIRTSGVGPGGLHPYRTLEQWGAQRREIMHDGVRRFWIEYAPERNVSREQKRPVVIFLHGGSQTGYTGMYAPEWMNVAESRDFILVMPTGTVREFGTSAPHPAWNAKRDPGLFDDEGFIRQIIDDVASRYEVDRGRVYVTGHSMGSAMTQRCALAMPELFAAVASNSGIVAGGFMGDFDSSGVREDIQMPAVWIQMGEHDVGGGFFEDNPKAERTCRYWVQRGSLGEFDQPSTYSCGRYKTRVWANEQGVPMLSYTVALDKPHAVMPQDAWFYYDEFFCKFSRDEEGRLRYMGELVR